MNGSTPLILEPNIISHKGHHSSSSKRRKTSSMRHDPLAFENLKIRENLAFVRMEAMIIILVQIKSKKPM